ncbi:unnamed protein product [Blepharisma stoltei]|uniref:Uncharacterized protein n=1 Tax=Blepharisma stoltei TaxID=1481888 RepID=A0AAU9JMM0_9CILI|nr:unnamed protein product [Blepharisma stoltei]
MFILLSLLTLGLAQDSDALARRTKLGTCLFLVRSKLSHDQDEFEPFFQSFPQEISDLVMNKAVADMLSQCIEDISEEEARELMMKFHNSEDLPVTNHIKFDKEEFKAKGDFQLTPEQVKLFDEIKEAQEKIKAAEGDYGQEEDLNPNREPLPLAHFGWSYILIIFGVFGAFFYFAIKLVLAADAPKKSKKNKKTN